jgi:hypothetical protein
LSSVVKIKDRVTIEEDTRVNVGGPKVTYYLGDAKKDEENFSVKGDNTRVTLNIMIPNGKLKITGGVNNCIMTGWYIIEKLESDGKNVYWNNNNSCGSTLARGNNNPIVVTQKDPVNAVPVIKETVPFEVRVYPNPSAFDFSIQVISKSNEPVTLRILDMNGKVRSVQTQLSKTNSIKVGNNLIGGTYFAEVTQGGNKQVVKLVKLN